MNRKKIIIAGIILLGVVTAIILAAFEINGETIINGILCLNKSPEPQELQFGTTGEGKITYDSTNGFIINKPASMDEIQVGDSGKKIKTDEEGNDLVIESNGDIVIQLGETP